MNRTLTISREYGSGGRELGVRLARKLRIPFYDKEIITMAAEDINLPEEALHAYDEVLPEDNEYVSIDPFSSIYQLPMSDEIFFAQSKAIKKLANQGPCVIVGRCADMILDDSIDLFVYADMKKRVERLLKLEPELSREEIEDQIRQVDNKRKEYYQYYTGNIWGRAQNYHLCLNSGENGIKSCINAVAAYLESL